MIISYDFGHGTGEDRGASGIVNEEVEIRRYAPITIQILEQTGHKCINCTPTASGMSLNDSLVYRVNHANASGSQLHLCFHVNAFNGSAHGAEVEVASDAGQKYGDSVLNEICALGFTRRGVNRPSLYVTKHTNMTAILIEPFFCDSAIDCKIYNPVSLGNAIAKGILNIIGGNYKPSNNVVVQPVTPPKPQYHVQYQAHVQNIGWQETKKDWDIAGTVGKGLRLEALTIKSDAPYKLNFEGHIQNIGWTERVAGEIDGTVGQGLRIEALKIWLDGAPSNVHIEYQAQGQNYGWQNVVRDGQVAGTTGQGLRLEAIRIRIVVD